MIKKLKFELVLLFLINCFLFSGEMKFTVSGKTNFGNWSSDSVISVEVFNPGKDIEISSVLILDDDYFKKIENANIKIDEFVILITAERTFDSNGLMHFASDERMSTILTPAGLPIEGGTQSALTKRYGYSFNTPLDLYQTVPVSSIEKKDKSNKIKFNLKGKIPDDLPPGIYRLRIDYGIFYKKNLRNLNNLYFPQRATSTDPDCSSYFYSPVIPANGVNIAGKKIDATKIEKRIPWVILYDYNSNGYKGVVAEEDKKYFNLSPRNIIQDDVILPLYYDWGAKASYNL